MLRGEKMGVHSLLVFREEQHSCCSMDSAIRYNTIVQKLKTYYSST